MGIEAPENFNAQEIATKKLNKKKMETSKKIILASYIIAITLTIIVIVGTFTCTDVSNLTSITCLVWSEVAASNIFYFNKAAKENVPKVIASLPQFFREQVDVNQLLNQ